jgi:hypothetical protein
LLQELFIQKQSFGEAIGRTLEVIEYTGICYVQTAVKQVRLIVATSKEVNDHALVLVTVKGSAI